MNDTKCLKCEWEGSYEDAVSFTEEELEALKEVLFTEAMFLGKPGYRMLLDWFGYMCPNCESIHVVDLHKLQTNAETSKGTFIQILQEIKNSLPKTISYAKP